MEAGCNGRTLALIAGPLVASVVLLRAYLHRYPDTDLMIAGKEVHHLFTGLLFVLVAAWVLAFGVTGRARDLALVTLLACAVLAGIAFAMG